MNSSEIKLRFLIVEDCPISRSILSKMVTQNGIVADCAENGQLAVSKISTENYDLVFMDIFMPEMDGKTATLEIRKTNKEIPIIALSGFALTDQECQDYGFNEVLMKPVNDSDMKGIINKYFPAKESASLQPQTVEEISHNNNLDNTSLKNAMREEQVVFDIKEGVEFAGGIDSLAEFLDIYLNGTPLNMDKLKKAISSGNLEQARFAAHLIRGESKSVGAKKIFFTATEIENASKDGKLDAAASLINELDSDFEDFKESIKKSDIRDMLVLRNINK